jgi:hypothetical protein
VERKTNRARENEEEKGKQGKQEKTKRDRNKKGNRREGQTRKEKETRKSREARRLKWRTNGSRGTADPFGADQSVLNDTKVCGDGIRIGRLAHA